jgi:hypothetical protein
MTGVGEPDVAPNSLEQWCTGLSFEHRQLLRDRACGVAEGAGGAVDCPARVHFAQEAQSMKVEHLLSIATWNDQ